MYNPHHPAASRYQWRASIVGADGRVRPASGYAPTLEAAAEALAAAHAA